MIGALQTLRIVDTVVVDRLRWWRNQGDASAAAHARCSLQHGSTPARTPASSAANAEAPAASAAVAATTTSATPSATRRRAHSAPLRDVSSCRSRERLLMPPRAAVELRHPQLLIFLRGEATAERRDAVQMALREVEGAVSIVRLPPAERDFYSAQLLPRDVGVKRDFLLSKQQPRRRAASTPALPAVTLDLCYTKGRTGVGNRSMPKSLLPNNHESSNNSHINKGVGVLPPLLRPTHQCRKVSCLQDSYVFHPDADFIGNGAFSRVFRAIPLFRGSSNKAFVAIKIIPRRRWKKNYPCISHRQLASKRKDMYMDKGGVRQEVNAGTVPHDRPVETGPRRGHVEEQDSLHRELVEIEREISIIRTLRHSGCSQFVEALRTPEEFVIVMKMGKGSIDAYHYLRLYGPPSEVRAALMIYQLMKTVNYLQHTCGFIHRDIKLENLLLSFVDVSPDCIRQALSADGLTHRSMTRGGGDADVVVEVEGKVPGDDDLATETELEGYVENADDANKPRSRSPSGWGPVPGGGNSDDFERLLKVTLIDFGLARRTTRRSDKHRSRGQLEPSQSRSAPCNSSSFNVRVGMPTPMPSAVDMFASVDSESSSCASSTDVSPSETSSASSMDDVERERNFDDNDDVDAITGIGGGMDGRSEILQVVSLNDAVDPSSATSNATVELASIPRQFAMELDSQRGDGGMSSAVSPSALPSTTTVAVNNSLADASSRALDDMPRRPMGQRSFFANASQSVSSAQAVVSVDGAEPRVRSSCDDQPDDGDMLLFLTPCGTDKYLPPEMLSWMVNNGWERKPTTVRMARQLDAYAIGIVTYVLLSGCFPFNGTSRASMAQQQKRCTPKCNSHHWAQISSKAISFVQSLLEPDPEVRSSVAEALVHPWMRHAAQLAEKLSLTPAPEEETQQMGSMASDTNRSTLMTPQYCPPVQQQHRSTRGGHPEYNSSLVAAESCAPVPGPRSHDVAKDHDRNSNAISQLLVHSVGGTRPSARIPQDVEENRKEVSTILRAAARTNKGADGNSVFGCMSSSARSSQASISPKAPMVTASSLLARIVATRRCLKEDSTLANGCFDLEAQSTLGNEGNEEKKEKKEEGGEEEDDDDGDDPFTRMFKTVMSEH
ncbi:protein kinase-like protein [Trypanosoma grayi]|uniref:protein kinase-like protein n=1 Tax=Trypanosoma grayi TaxID=71804 RepID=UPI0004F43EC6|nr:protein kinase-like protein [Trypanosoma grayi]KEG09459.1 protein kinase-like protein [Trypanosoma grayi]